MRNPLLNGLLVWVTVSLMACGGGQSSAVSTPTFVIGGQVSGLSAGGTLVLSDNGSDSLTITTNGSFSFGQSVTQGGAYAVTVTTQPTGQVCTLVNANGTNVHATVSTIAVTCGPATYAVGGTLTGLKSGNQLVLSNNAGDPLTLTTDGAFSFASKISNGGDYAVTVTTQPSGQFCEITDGAGANVTSDISTVAVVCSLFFDNFSRADQVGLGLAPNSVAWLVSGAGTSTIAIANHQYVDGSPALGNRVAYALMALGALPSRLGGSFSFLPFVGSGANNSAVALISTLDTGITFDHAVHLVVDRYNAGLTYYVSGVSYQPASCLTGPTANFNTPLSADGTAYSVEMALSGSHVVISLPQGLIIDCTDSHFAELAGAQAMWEIYSPSTTSDAAPAWNSAIAFP